MNAPTLRAANRLAFYKTEVVAMGEFEYKPFDGIGADTSIPADSEREFSAKIADVDIRDDFMFSYVMCNRQICTELLQCLLPEHRISRIEYYEMGEDGADQPEDSSNRYAPLEIDTQKALAEAFNKRGVRLDVYIDDGKSVYNVEMQTTKQSGLSRRARLYQAHIDINQLRRGQIIRKIAAEIPVARPTLVKMQVRLEKSRVFQTSAHVSRILHQFGQRRHTGELYA